MINAVFPGIGLPQREQQDDGSCRYKQDNKKSPGFGFSRKVQTSVQSTGISAIIDNLCNTR